MIFPIVIPQNNHYPTPIEIVCPDGFCPTLIKKDGTLAPLNPTKIKLNKLYIHMLLDRKTM